MHFGLLVPGGEGHLNPLLALAFELQQRGHQVTFFGMPRALAAAKAASIGVIDFAEKELPLGTFGPFMKIIAKGTAPWRIPGVTKQTAKTREAFLLAVDDWMRCHPNQLDCLLIDSLSLHLYLLGERHQIPYILLDCSIPAFLSSPNMPPTMLGWDYSDSWFGRIRDYLGNAMFARSITRFFSTVQNKYAQAWSLPRSKDMGDSRQALARITQVPAGFDFPRQDKDRYIYTGPWINSSKRVQPDFPWEELNDKLLIYAALGTLYNDQSTAYQIIAQACSQLDCQLVLSIGPHVPDEVLKDFQHQYPQFVFIRKAPQVELLQRAELFITHAGMNSTLEALQAGVPMVAIPIGNDQPGVAARIRYHQVGISVPFKRLSVDQLHKALKQVLHTSVYTDNAKHFAKLIQQKPGLILAAEAIERVVGT